MPPAATTLSPEPKHLPAWLFMILRNVFRSSEYRKRRHGSRTATDGMLARLENHPEQAGWRRIRRVSAGACEVTAGPREALILVGASGFSYKEAADICGCAVGDESRVHRARFKLVELLSIEGIDDFGRDQANRAVVAGAINMSVRYSNLANRNMIRNLATATPPDPPICEGAGSMSRPARGRARRSPRKICRVKFYQAKSGSTE